MKLQRAGNWLEQMLRGPEARLVFGILAIAFLLRAVVLPLPGFKHADEVWQYLEPAYYLAFDRWIIAWEYRDGIRTWLIPILLALPMKLGGAIAPDSGLHLLLTKLLLVLLSLSIVACSTALGLRISRLHGLMAGFVTAIWAELVYYGPRAMSEPVSLALFFPAALLLTMPREKRTARLYLLAGFLLGLCFCARFQFAPALAVLALWTCGARWRAWGWLVLGGLLGLGLDALVDLAVGEHPPLRWIYENFRVNLIENKSASYGVEPWYWYLAQIANYWRLALLAILPLMVLGARRYPVLMAVAVVNLLAHSAIPHKEDRFVLLSTGLMVFLAAIGGIDLLRRLTMGDTQRLHRFTAWACGFWALCSLMVAFAGPLRLQWKNGQSIPRTLQLAGEAPGACGLALYRPTHPLSAAHVFYNRNTPVYLFNPGDEATAVEYRPAFNLVMAMRGKPVPGAEYQLLGCPDKSHCIYQRAGSCQGVVPSKYELNTALTSLGM